jgi:hypothetical protein
MWHDKHNIELFEADSALIFNKSPEKLNLSSLSIHKCIDIIIFQLKS